MRMYESAQRSYEKELDIVHFIKLQKITQSLHKMLYTDFERFLLANNTCFVRCKGHDVTDEERSYNPMQQQLRSKHFDRFFKGALVPEKTNKKGKRRARTRERASVQCHIQDDSRDEALDLHGVQLTHHSMLHKTLEKKQDKVSTSKVDKIKRKARIGPNLGSK